MTGRISADAAKYNWQTGNWDLVGGSFVGTKSEKALAIASYSGSVNITGSVISNNTDNERFGGGGIAIGYGSHATVTDCTFTANTADQLYGAGAAGFRFPISAQGIHSVPRPRGLSRHQAAVGTTQCDRSEQYYHAKWRIVG